MPESLSVRIPPHVEQKLSEHCARQGITRTEAIVRALDFYLDEQCGGPSAYALAADLIPRRGARDLQSANVRKLARDAFRGARAR